MHCLVCLHLCCKIRSCIFLFQIISELFEHLKPGLQNHKATYCLQQTFVGDKLDRISKLYIWGYLQLIISSHFSTAWPLLQHIMDNKLEQGYNSLVLQMLVRYNPNFLHICILLAGTPESNSREANVSHISFMDIFSFLIFLILPLTTHTHK